MAKKQLTKFEKQMKNAERVYTQMKDELGLHGDCFEQVHQLVEKGCEVHGEICNAKDKITVEGFDKAVMTTLIDKPTWVEFVTMTAKKNMGKLKDAQLEKFEKNCEERRYISNQRQSFYDTYLSDNKLKVIDEDSEQDYNFDNAENSEFAALIEEYAKVKDYMNVLSKRMDKLATCAIFITSGELDKKTFKNLVEWEYYKESEDPKNPSKSYKLFESFMNMIKTMEKYEFVQIDDLKYEFGLDWKYNIPHPQPHSWMSLE